MRLVMAKKEHPKLISVPVKELPKKLRDLYVEECNKSLNIRGKSLKQVDFNANCSCGFRWDSSIQGIDFWSDVYDGVWDEEHDSEETLDNKLSNVLNLIKKIPR